MSASCCSFALCSQRQCFQQFSLSLSMWSFFHSKQQLPFLPTLLIKVVIMFKSIPQLNIIIKKQVKPNVLGLHHCGINKCVVLFLFCCRQPKAAFRAPEEVCSASLITCGAASGAERRCAQRNAAPHWSGAELQPGQSRSAEQSRCWSAALTGGQN